ncbi:hypothetical protein [Rudaea cellulosilytica]|uniref:hypothetical protein n=1 Tax=Rudaea cellulosilytica TaxID=540746 RepID=UPI00037E997D|nr:hypothetical protein [Rudaea cellulosilytica]
MISNPAVARKISDLMIECSKRLTASVAEIKESCSETEFVEYRAAVARIMADMLREVMNPLYKQHPQIKPTELK